MEGALSDISTPQKSFHKGEIQAHTQSYSTAQRPEVERDMVEKKHGTYIKLPKLI